MFDKVANLFNSGKGGGGEVPRLMVANFSKLEEAMEEASLVKLVSPCYKNVVSLILLNSC